MSTYTQEHAKNKWCPFARVSITDFGNSTSANRTRAGGVHSLNGENYCIANGCMAWRWAPRERHELLSLDGEPVDRRQRTLTAKQVKRSKLVGPHYDPPHGYCGLAGRP